jgi:phosphoserine phosphatase
VVSLYTIAVLSYNAKKADWKDAEMLTVYLTRHGETVWNTQNRMQGRQDSPLTGEGLAQAADLARQLAGIALDRIWTSPAPRAVQTADRIAAAQSRPVPVEIDDRIHEMALGSMEGLSVDQANALDPENMQAFFYRPQDFRPLGDGEDFQQVSDRMALFLDDLTAYARLCERTGEDRRVLVISHNITLKALFALMANRPLAMLRDGPPIRQATLYRAWLKSRWHIEFMIK